MGTHPCAGHYTSLAGFEEATFKRLGAITEEPGLRLKVRNVVGGGDQEWAVVELIAEAVCKNGLKFDNTYAWVVEFDEKGMVVQVRAYLDSTLVKQAVEENECPSHPAPITELAHEVVPPAATRSLEARESDPIPPVANHAAPPLSEVPLQGQVFPMNGGGPNSAYFHWPGEYRYR